MWFALELAGDDQKGTDYLCLIPAIGTCCDDQAAQANLAMRIGRAEQFGALLGLVARGLAGLPLFLLLLSDQEFCLFLRRGFQHLRQF
ncbi:hypothetical protein A7X61_17895 [Stenotrophomonas maltophilia]|nr:hypothetical protein A7X61_17895 [Stenotrophomonas maltophilia]